MEEAKQKDHILYDSINMKCQNRQIHREKKVDEWLPRAGAGSRMEKRGKSGMGNGY